MLLAFLLLLFPLVHLKGYWCIMAEGREVQGGWGQFNYVAVRDLKIEEISRFTGGAHQAKTRTAETVCLA